VAGTKVAKISISRRGDLNKALESLAKKIGTSPSVRVGFLEGRTYPASKKGGKPLPVARVAFWNEFGTQRAPARPFFRNTIANLEPTLGKRLAAVAKSVGYDGEKTMALMGLGIKDKLVRAIAEWPPDNAPSTVAKKGFNHGLIDKGVMQRSVDYEVKT